MTGLIGSQAQTIVTSSKEIFFTALLAKKFCESFEIREPERCANFHFSDGSSIRMTFRLDRAFERIYESSEAYMR